MTETPPTPEQPEEPDAPPVEPTKPRPSMVRVTPPAPASAPTQPAVEPEPPTEPTSAEPTPAGAATRRRHRRRGLPVVALLAAVVLALTATATYLFLQVRSHEQTEDARRQATAAARSAAKLLLSYDHRSLEADFQAAREVTTGQFREDYEETTEKVVGPTATQYKAVVEADVITVSVSSAEEDEVVVVAFVNQVTTSTRVDGPKIDQNRVRLTMVERGGEWLVSDVDAL